MAESSRNRIDQEIISLPYELMSKISNRHGDRLNVFLLTLLYAIQGFIIGFSEFAVPFILQSNRNVTYEDQALFSIVLWPHTVNILWAPIVDVLYVKRIGRRKSWLIFLQLLMVTLLVYLALNIDHWLPETGKANIKMMVLVVLFLNLLSATQDIVVDGWSLTMLEKKNINYSSTCEAYGVPIGMFIGSGCFILLVSEKFSEEVSRNGPGSGGLVTMKSFLCCWATLILFVTFLVGFFKKEKQQIEDNPKKISVFQSYKLLWDVLRIPSIKVLAVALLTTSVGFIGTDKVSYLKLIDNGVSKENIIIILMATSVVKFIMPVFVNKYIMDPDPMKYYLKMTPYRLLLGIVFVIFVYVTPKFIQSTAVVYVRVFYYLLFVCLCIINEMLSFFMHLTLRAFFCRISDPRFGGTYMALFETLHTVGLLVPKTFILDLVNILTLTYVDGYYIVMITSIILGFVWFGIFKNIIKKYQSKGLFDYAVNGQRSADTDEINEPCISSPI